MADASKNLRRSGMRVPSEKQRSIFRQALLEGLERRELMAVASAAPVFAQGTDPAYVTEWINRLANPDTIGGGGSGSGSQTQSSLSAPINLSGDRWTVPTGGLSPNEGDPAVVTWSIIRDGTTYSPGVSGTGNSNLVGFLDSIYGGGTGPLSNRPWFSIIQSAYDRWSQVSGLTFVYEPNDDGVALGAGRGVAGVRGDVRIGGRNIDGNSNILAFNFFPNAGGADPLDGDMVIDTNDNFYRNTSQNSLGLFNVLMHEAGHGIGLGHVIPTNQTKLMEPFVSFAYRGAQYDDILAAQTLYGDDKELLGGARFDLGVIPAGTTVVSDLSIHRNADTDEFQFNVGITGRLTVRLRPVGRQYLVGPQGGVAAPVDTFVNKNLSLQLLDSTGTVLQNVNANPAGQDEVIARFNISAGNGYRLRIAGDSGETQTYELELTTSGPPEPPRLLSVSANSGQTFNPNVGNTSSANVLHESPRELIFRFSGSQQLDPASLAGIRITRSGGDNDFANGNEVVVNPTYIGFGDTERIVIARFGQALPDDRYRIEVLGVDVDGLPAVQSIEEANLLPRFPGTDRDTYYMNLELGAQVTAIVPQPVTRKSDGTLEQSRNTIEVYFNDDDLDPVSAQNPEFYQLILTKDSVNSNDDVVFVPTSVTYSATSDKAVLTFGTSAAPLNIDELAGGAGTFRLRIGSNRAVASLAVPKVPTVITPPGADVGDTLSSALSLGNLGTNSSLQIDSTVVVAASNILNLDYPGGTFEPGHRDIRDETHLNGGADGSPGISTIFYNFAENRSYGTGTAGQPLFTSITPDQKARVREIFEFYGFQAGIDFVESVSSGLTIVVGDMTPLLDPPPPFVPAGIAGGNLAIMNGTLNWDNGLGAGFFDVALHEIGHLLGLGHSYELPSGTVMGSTGQLNSGNPVEFFFPGDHDIAHLQHIHRPDNRDVDLYKFDVPVGQGTLVVETIAERLGDSSNLDTYVTLLQRDASGSLKIVASNNDYFSSDSFVRVDLSGVAGTEYFIAVTSRGNENFDAKIANSGSGGVSQGRYRLRVDYRPSNTTQLIEPNGTALDGDGDGLAGGEFNFWFRAASPTGVAPPGAPRTIFVDKDNPLSGADGSLGNPYPTIPAAIAAAAPGDIVRLIGSAGQDRDLATVADNVAYEIGDGGPGKGVLADGPDFLVPNDVTLMIENGAILKLATAEILVGSDDASNDRSGAAIQVLGTPQSNVYFTSHFDESLGIDTNLLNTNPARGQWGGIEIRNDVDRQQGRRNPELDGIFLNYVGGADIRYGGGSIGQGLLSRTVTPIHLNLARPTLLNNKISFSADAGISADPNSFEETTFSEPRYQFTGAFVPDYVRVGPDIRGQAISQSSTNGLFIRIDTTGGQQLTLNVPARLDDTGVTYVLGENLVIAGTPGGSFQEIVRPDLSLVVLTQSAGGALTAGETYNYVLVNIDRFGVEGLPSSVPPTATLSGANGTLMLQNLPGTTGDFVGRRLYRKTAASSTWTFVAELDRTASTFIDVGTSLATGIVLNSASSLQRARIDASLVIDPGVVVKSQGSRIEIGIGANLIAEGTVSEPIIFTSRRDDRYGAGPTFDTNSDASATSPTPGNWSGIFARHASSVSLDSIYLGFGGGTSSISGGFASFNAVEVYQAQARIANSTLEQNAAGNSVGGASNRDYHGTTDASVIHVVASQPAIYNNVIRNNAGAAISVDVNAMKAVPVRDHGRQTGLNQRASTAAGNLGPLVIDNRLGGNSINGMRIRGATLTTESVWDDTDMVHVLQSQIVVPDFHTFGGLSLRSKGDESLVVKLSGANAGFTANGRPLDITDRIGGSLQIVGSPAFPVVLTSLSDDTIGAGYDWEGRAMFDTNNNLNATLPDGGDWRSIRLDAYSNDRNVETVFETETDPVGDTNRNDLPSAAQAIGTLADNLNGGDENVRLGFSVRGTIAAPSDLDVYRLIATAGTTVWLDIDRTGAALDSVVELISSTGQILAQSDNSFDESTQSVGPGGKPLYINNALLAQNGRAFSMNQSAFVSATDDFQSTNPLDAGMRIILPGTAGTVNTYFIRVRSSNLSPTDTLPPTDPGYRLAALNQVSNGLSVGPYRLQVRLQQEDEIGGSTIRNADIRYATSGIEVLGMPAHSPLVRETVEVSSNPNANQAQNVGNVGNSDRAAISIAGSLSGNGALTPADDVDWYRFRVFRDSIQATDPAGSLSVTFDLDYSDGLGRADTTLWVYQLDGNGANPRLVLIGTDSNIADDRNTPTETNDFSDLTRGSVGPRDPFIGAQVLPGGEYLVAVSNGSRVDARLQQFTQANPGGGNNLVRLEPVQSVVRIAEDTFDAERNFPTPDSPPKQVAVGGFQNSVPFNLADVTLFVAQTDESAGTRSRLLYANSLTGAREGNLNNSYGANVQANDIAVHPAGTVVSAIQRPTAFNDATNNLSQTNQDGTGFTATNAGLDTFEHNGTNVVTHNVGMEFTALAFGDTSTSDDGTGALSLWGVARRGDNAPFTPASLTDANPPVVSAGVANSANAFKNIVYRLDPNTLQAISPAGTTTRAANGTQATGTGTNIREIGVFGKTSTYDWRNFGTTNVQTGDTTTVTTQVGAATLANSTEGIIVGLARVGDSLYGLSELGELWRMQLTDGAVPFGVGNGGELTNNLNTNLVVPPLVGGLPRIPSGAAVKYTGLTRGPRNVEGGIYKDTLFAVDTEGRIYAFNTSGALQPIFPGAVPTIRQTGTNGLGTVRGIDFSSLDVNLWHVSNNRAGEAGHGRPVTPDGIRTTNQAGGNSLYFGLETSNTNVGDGTGEVVGNWRGSFNLTALQDSYNLPGGARGAVESNPIDLSSYSTFDKPMLYFNYFLETDNTNSTNGASSMLDSLRVYGELPDGTSILLATNNSSDDGDLTNGNNEFDPAATGGNTDIFAKAVKPQVLYDVGDGGAPTSWRQARVNLSALAGLPSVVLRFEFTSQGSYNSNDPLRGGVELKILPGHQIADGDTFSITGPDPLSTTVPPANFLRTFEFDLGLVLNIPSGKSITAGNQLNVEGRTFTFVTGAAGANQISFSVNDTPNLLAAKVSAALTADGFTVFTNSNSPNILNVQSGTRPVTGAVLSSVLGLASTVIVSQAGTSQANLILDLPAGSLIANNSTLTIQGVVYTFKTSSTGAQREIIYAIGDTAVQIRDKVRTALQTGGQFIASPAAGGTPRLTIASGTTIVRLPGVHSSSDPDVAIRDSSILINQSMTAAQVLASVRSSLASNFNAVGQTGNVNVWKTYQNTIQLYGYTVNGTNRLGVGVQRPGDFFGPNATQTDSNARFNQAGLRGRNNNNEGVYIDDIIIAPAERGELVINSSTAAATFQENYFLTDGGYVPESVPPVADSTYQLEIRTAADFTTLEPDPELVRRYDSNDRLTQQLSLVVNSGAGAFNDGDTFTLSDGKAQLTFEFDIVQSTTDPAFSVTSGRVPIRIAPDMSANQIATAIRNAINGTAAQSIIKMKAGVVGEVSNGFGGYLTSDNGHVIDLHGSVAGDLSGSTNLIAGLSFALWGTESSTGEDGGDSNRRRDQGQIVINSNTVRNSSSFGIVVDHAARSQTALANFVGDRPYPGAVANLVTNNTAGIAPGVVVMNNIVASNLGGGIRISGDNTATPEAVSNIARVVNNTVFGSQAIQQGILVEQSARATILNNILASLNVGIAVTTNGQAVLGSNIYQSNVTQNVTGTTLGANDIALPGNAPLFVDPSNSRFYLAALSQAIDSSNSALPELALLSQVKNAVGLPASPLLAPDRDIAGIARVDDPAVTSSGQGPNVHVDRGAVERADSNRIKAVLVNPLDNDSANVDVDRNSTYVRVLNGNFEYFSILLTDDQGSGPDARTVVSNSVLISENGRPLIEGVDYTFGYNAGSNTILLTPLAGLWRRDSVYEIMLINKPTARVSLRNGSEVVDGDNLTVTLADGSSRTIEFESGFVIDVPQAVTPQLADTQTITFQRAGGAAQVFELVLGNRTVGPNIRPIAILNSDTYLSIADKIASALAGVVTGGVPVQHLGLGRIHVGGFVGDQLQVSNRFVIVSGQPGVSGSLELAVPTVGGTGITDSQTFSIRNAAGNSVVFEFDSDTFFTGTNRVIAFLPTDSAAIIAGKIATAISASGLGLTATTLPGGIVRLNEPVGTVVNLSLSSLTSTGVAGGAIPLSYVPSQSNSSYDLAMRTIQVLNQLGQGIKAYSAGGGTIFVEGATNVSGTSVMSLVGIRDIAGNALETNRPNATTQFTIVMPDVVFDYGDAPGVNAQTLQTGNGARHAILPPDGSQIFLGTSPDSESDGQPNVNALGDDGAGRDDEDGVTIDGMFNSRVPATNVTVNASGTGIVDAWVDWNRDGDFTDVGEQVITNQPVFAGNTTFIVQTPTAVSVGGSFMRVRLSTLGNLLSGGVGIGGEVEDHPVQIVRSFPPTLDDDSYVTNEDVTLAVAAADGLLQGDTDADGNTITVFDSDPIALGIQPATTPSNGMLTLNVDGSFTYVPNLNFFGTDTFTYHAIDSLGVRSLTPATVTITVSPINDAPEFTLTSNTLVVGEDGVVNGSAPGPVSIPGFATGIRPGPLGSGSEGTLTGFSVVANNPSIFSNGPAIDLNGTLTFTLSPDINSNFLGFDGRVTITLSDGDSSVAPNQNSSTTTLTIDVTPINDPPLPNGFRNASDNLVFEEGSKSFDAALVLDGDLVGPATALDESRPPQQQFVTIIAMQNTSAAGGIVTPVFDTLNPNVIVRFNYAPPQDFVGLDTFTYTLSDNLTGNPQTAVGTITIEVTGINDAPEFTIPSVVTATEDEPAMPRVGFATGIRKGPVGAVDEAGQGLTFDVVALEEGFFDDLPAITADGTLTFTLKPDRNRNWPKGASNLIRVTLRDNGDSDAPNVNTSVTQMFSIDIAPVNDPPVVQTPFSPTVAEEASTVFTATQLLAGTQPSHTGALTDESSQDRSIIAVDPRSVGGGLISATLSGGSISNIRYIPAPNFVGADTFTYLLADNGTPVATTVVTVTVNVTPINDAPEFTAGADVVVNEDSGSYSQGWATAIRPGPLNAPDESTQDLRFEVSTTNPSLFSTGGLPAISPLGVLTFTGAPNATGTALVTVSLIDLDSGTLPNVNQSSPITLTITLAAVNDPPVFTPGGNVTVAEDAGVVSQPWATNIFAAAGLTVIPQQSTEESSQTVSFLFSSNSNPSLFSSVPSISSDGTLTFTTANNAFGNAVVTVVAQDNGSSDLPNINQSPAVTFTINITAANDPPTASTQSFTASENTVGVLESNPNVKNNASDPEGDSFTVVPGNFTSASGASIVLSTDGTFVYDPTTSTTIDALLNGATLTDTFTYQLRDVFGETSLPITVSVTVLGINDPPRTVSDTFSVSPSGSTNLNVLRNVRDPDSTIDRSSLEIGVFPLNGTVTTLPDGTISYTPRPGFVGSDSFSYRVKDVQGTTSAEATINVRINNSPVALGDSARVLAGNSVIVPVLNNDTDPDGNSTIVLSSVRIVALPLFGTATVLSDGTISYAAPSDTSGRITFEYTVADVSGGVSSPATVNIDVVRSLYQNPASGLNADVNNDGFVTPIDALILINDINRNGVRTLSPTAFTPPPFLDVNADGQVTPFDILLVINVLNRPSGSGEGESSAIDVATPPVVSSSVASTSHDVLMVTPEQMISSVAEQVAIEAKHFIQSSAITELDGDFDSESVPEIVSSETLTRKKLVDDIFADDLHPLLGD
jgi:VCBS repeat-containing protein